MQPTACTGAVWSPLHHPVGNGPQGSSAHAEPVATALVANKVL